MLRCCGLLLLAFLHFVTSAQAAPVDAFPREKIDAVARGLEPETLPQAKVDLGGRLAEWSILRVPLPASEELARCKKAHEELLKAKKVQSAPLDVKRLLARLCDHLPRNHQIEDGSYSVHLLTRPDLSVSTPGAGYIYLTPALLEALPKDKSRDAVLAWLLAREIGHVALQHTRIAWKRAILEENLKKGSNKLEPSVWRDLLQTTIEPVGCALNLTYSRVQEYEADLFAWHLCRNAGYEGDQVLDALRLLALLRHGDALKEKMDPTKSAIPATLCYYLTDSNDPLVRLRRLLLEREGRVDYADRFGLFLYNRTTGELTKFARDDLKPKDRPIVFAHGLQGNAETFRLWIKEFADRKEFDSRPLLVFVWPGNGSLVRAGLYLEREMKRLVPNAKGTTFICHSAGGLVFRWYAEVQGGEFERAVLMGTPHKGSDLTSLKGFVDMVEFAGRLKTGWWPAVATTVAMGSDETRMDLHPDSLFLRALPKTAKTRERYHIVFGDFLDRKTSLGLMLAVGGGKRLLKPQLARLLPAGWLLNGSEQLVEELKLPTQMVDGDLVVSTNSANLAGAGKVTKTTLHHLLLLSDAELMKLVAKDVE
jgi:pimeloyl-ACP methyl ester carboxylesterase